MAALSYAQRTGIGQHVDLAMINAMFFTDDYAHFQLDGRQRPRRRWAGVRRHRRADHAGRRREVVLAGAQHAGRRGGPDAGGRRPRHQDRAPPRGDPGVPALVPRPGVAPRQARRGQPGVGRRPRPPRGVRPPGFRSRAARSSPRSTTGPAASGASPTRRTSSRRPRPASAARPRTGASTTTRPSPTGSATTPPTWTASTTAGVLLQDDHARRLTKDR